MRRVFVVSLLGLAFWLVAAGSAVADWRWNRDISYSGSTGHAAGKTCDGSRFSVWHWRGTVHSGGDTYRFRWLERITHDGHFHHLAYQSVHSTAFDGLSPQEQETVESAILDELDRTRVSWFDNNGREYLEYRLPDGEDYNEHWTPHQASC